MMAAAVEAMGSTFHWESPKELFKASYVGFNGLSGQRNYDVARDGRFLMVKQAISDPSASPSIIVVENWTEELKRLVPTR